MLVACGKPDTDLDDVQPAVAPKANSTAIFLPGGGGIDFGIPPIWKARGKNPEGIENSQSYKFRLVEPLIAVEAAVEQVLLEQGYVKKIITDTELSKKFERFIHFTKDNNLVVVMLNHSAAEGFKLVTELDIWHRL